MRIIIKISISGKTIQKVWGHKRKQLIPDMRMREVTDSLCGESFLHSFIFLPKHDWSSLNTRISYTTEKQKYLKSKSRHIMVFWKKSKRIYYKKL